MEQRVMPRSTSSLIVSIEADEQLRELAAEAKRRTEVALENVQRARVDIAITLQYLQLRGRMPPVN
jgi:hypothetical protein